MSAPSFGNHQKAEKTIFYRQKRPAGKGAGRCGIHECDYNRLQVFFKRLLLISFTKKLMQKLVILRMTVHRAS
jgi:hypothetical protein